MIRQGDIVRVCLYDPNGKNPKHRRAVVVTKTDEIESDSSFVVAAISTKFDKTKIPAHYIEIPWHRDGHVKTSLTEPSVVKCDWLDEVNFSDADKAGYLPGKHLLAVLEQIANLSRE